MRAHIRMSALGPKSVLPTLVNASELTSVYAHLLALTGTYPPAGRDARSARRGRRSSLYELRVQREIGMSEAVLCRPGLVPVGVDERRLAHLVEARALLVAELHVDRGEIVAELRFGPAADD